MNIILDIIPEILSTLPTLSEVIVCNECFKCLFCSTANWCPWNVLTTNEQCQTQAYKDYLFLMCSVIAAHLPDPANVVATAVQCENLNWATSLCLIIEALVCVSWFGWYTCRMHAIYPHTPRLSHFFMFFFSLSTPALKFCSRVADCCFVSPPLSLLSFSSASLSLPCKSWVIYLWHELDVSVRQARRHFISPKVAGYRFHYLLILWFLRGFTAVQELMLPLCHVQKIQT